MSQDEFADPADLPEASYLAHPVDELEPVSGEQFLSDCLLDALARWKGDLPRTMDEMRGIFILVVNEGIKEALASGWSSGENHDAMDAVAKLLEAFTKQVDPYDGRVLAWAYLLAINRCNFSEVQIAHKCGVTKADISKLKIEIQERLGIIPRCNRSEKARETFSVLCKQHHQKKQLHPTKNTASWSLKLSPNLKG